MIDPSTIVLISIDDLRNDCLSGMNEPGWAEQYGASNLIETPTLDDLMLQGTTFTTATSTSSATPPSHGAMFSGLYPKENGVQTFFTPLNNDVTTIASYLSDQGYETSAWLENIALDLLDITYGFDEVISPFRDPEANLFNFIQDRNDREKSFIFIHLFDVHKPYLYIPGGTERNQYNDEYLKEMKEEIGSICDISTLLSEAEAEAANDISNFNSLTDPLSEYGKYRSLDYLIRQNLESSVGDDRFKYLVRLYIKGISKFDRTRFADLVDCLQSNNFDDHFTIVTSDHGETHCKFFDREDLMNGPNVSEGAVRIPFITLTDLPDLQDTFQENLQTKLPINHIDILPTIQHIVEGHYDEELSGESILDLIEAPDGDRKIFHEMWYGPEGADFFGNYEIDTGEGGLSEVAVRDYPRKVTFSEGVTGNPSEAAYDVEVDPLEENNLIDERNQFENLISELLDYVDGMPTTITVSENDIPDDRRDDIEEQLRALGYKQ